MGSVANWIIQASERRLLLYSSRRLLWGYETPLLPGLLIFQRNIKKTEIFFKNCIICQHQSIQFILE
jgi:hypothetical protein